MKKPPAVWIVLKGDYAVRGSTYWIEGGLKYVSASEARRLKRALDECKKIVMCLTGMVPILKAEPRSVGGRAVRSPQRDDRPVRLKAEAHSGAPLPGTHARASRRSSTPRVRQQAEGE